MPSSAAPSPSEVIWPHTYAGVNSPGLAVSLFILSLPRAASVPRAGLLCLPAEVQLGKRPCSGSSAGSKWGPLGDQTPQHLFPAGPGPLTSLRCQFPYPAYVPGCERALRRCTGGHGPPWGGSTLTPT